ncbi:MAG: 4Fe-4S binding protein, partial [Dehalococcoidia bacterium]
EFHTLKLCNVSVDHHYAKSRYEAKIDSDLCDGCQNCIDNCNFDAIDRVKQEGSKKLKAQVSPELCFGCGCCYMVCETKAISLECVRPVSHVPGVVA